MAGDRARLVPAGPARQAQAQAEVDVLQVGEEALVEAAGVEHRLAPVQRGAGARGEDLAGRVPAPVVGVAPPPLLAHAVAAQHVAGVVDDRGIAQADHLAATAACPPRARRPVSSSQRGSSSTSVLTSATASARRLAHPAVRGGGEAGVAAQLDHRASGARCASHACVPSVEPLSTTTTCAGATVWARATRTGRAASAARSSSGRRPRRPSRPTEAMASPRGRRGRRSLGRGALGLERLVDERAEALAEVVEVEALGVLDARRRIDRAGVERADGAGERRGRRGLVERAGLALADRLADAALVEGDDRPPGGLGLDGGDPELLGRGDDERARAGEQLRGALVASHGPRSARSGRRGAAAGARRARCRSPPAAGASR